MTKGRAMLESLHTLRLRRVLRDSAGDTLIEMAIALPTLLMLIFGVCAFSLLLTSWCSATYAVRVATRYASLHSVTSVAPATVASVTNLVKSQLFMPGATGTNVTLLYYQNVSNPGNYIGNGVYVTITWNQSISVPYYRKTLSLQSVQWRVVSR